MNVEFVKIPAKDEHSHDKYGVYAFVEKNTIYSTVFVGELQLKHGGGCDGFFSWNFCCDNAEENAFIDSKVLKKISNMIDKLNKPMMDCIKRWNKQKSKIEVTK